MTANSEIVYESVSIQTIGVNSEVKLVTCPSWLFPKQHNIVMPRACTVYVKEALTSTKLLTVFKIVF